MRLFRRRKKRELWVCSPSTCPNCGYTPLDYGPAICPKCGSGWWVGTSVQSFPIADVLFHEAIRDATMRRQELMDGKEGSHQDLVTLSKGAFNVQCQVRCASCGQTFTKLIGCCTFASDTFEKAGWRPWGRRGMWLCPECSKYQHKLEQTE